MFGGFGAASTAAKPATGFQFGAPATTTTTTAPTGGLFGAQLAPSTTTTGGLFGQQSTGLFGQKPQTQAPGLFGQQPQQQQQQSLGLFGQPAQPQQPQQQQPTTDNSIEREVQAIMAAYNAQDARCRFRHPFYNLVAVEEAPRYQRPPHIPEGVWTEAVRASPDPSCMVPAFASGFGDIQKRIEHQNRQAQQHRAKLEEVAADLDTVQNHQDVAVCAKLNKCRQEVVKLCQKLLRVMGLMQQLRSHGHTVLTREEEELRARFDGLLKQLRKTMARSRLDELETQASSFHHAQNSAPLSTTRVDGQVTQEAFKVLQDMQVGLQRITAALCDDVAVLDAIQTTSNSNRAN